MIEVFKTRDDWISQTVGSHAGEVCNTIAWSSNIGSNDDILASGGDDGKVLVWSKDKITSDWTQRSEIDFEDPITRVSWNQSSKIYKLII